MSVLLFKLLSIAAKTLARPMINWLSYYNRMKIQESKNILAIFMRNRLVFLGQNFHYYNTLFNRKIFGLSKEQAIKPLTTDKALERGAELITEGIVYFLLLILPVIEMVKSYKLNKVKELKKKQGLIDIQNKVYCLVETNDFNEKNIYEIKDKLIKIKSELQLL
jgi:hypothetical protein